MWSRPALFVSAMLGVVAKHRDLRYESGRRAMVKVKHERTLDCVVAGARLADRDHLASLLLGLYGDDGRLHSVGVVAGFNRTLAGALWHDVRSCATTLASSPPCCRWGTACS